jgi:hypothetical protein
MVRVSASCKAKGDAINLKGLSIIPTLVPLVECLIDEKNGILLGNK